ncbi:hypothetical protein B566_EDAN014877 [Ephemera danica]|nr:hypothetical protein B566_EDAN014877 [Ephemera danica]
MCTITSSQDEQRDWWWNCDERTQVTSLQAAEYKNKKVKIKKISSKSSRKSKPGRNLLAIIAPCAPPLSEIVPGKVQDEMNCTKWIDTGQAHQKGSSQQHF